jgi:CheY-like chemotaxis protein
MPASKKRLIFSRASGMFLPGMKESLLLLLSRDGDEFRLLKDAFHGTSVRLVAMADASMAIAEAGVSQPDLLVVGPSVRSIEARWFLERIMANPALRDIPMVMMFYEVRRSWVLEMIKLGLRAYLMLPREKDDLRRRLIQHLPAARIPAHARVGLPKPRESVGERLRQRIAKRQLEQAAAACARPHAPDSSPAQPPPPSTPPPTTASATPPPCSHRSAHNCPNTLSPTPTPTTPPSARTPPPPPMQI